MISETIGSGQDRATIVLWEQNISNTDDQTGTCMDSGDLAGANVTFNAANSGGYTYLLTADSSVEISEATFNDGENVAAKSDYRFYTSGGAGWIFERIGLSYGGFNLLDKDTVYRRCVFINGGLQVFAGTATHTADNCAFANNSNRAVLNNVSGATLNLYHCSACVGSSLTSVSAASGGTVNCYACIVVNTSTGACFSGCGGDENVSSDTSAPGSTVWTNETAPFTNQTASNQDLSLVVGKQGSFSVSDYSGTVPDVATDIEGTTRTGTIDAGVWQTPAAVGGATFKGLTLLGVGGYS